MPQYTPHAVILLWALLLAILNVQMNGDHCDPYGICNLSLVPRPFWTSLTGTGGGLVLTWHCLPHSGDTYDGIILPLSSVYDMGALQQTEAAGILESILRLVLGTSGILGMRMAK